MIWGVLITAGLIFTIMVSMNVFRTDNPAVIFALPLYAIGAAVMGLTVWHTILAVGQALGFH